MTVCISDHVNTAYNRNSAIVRCVLASRLNQCRFDIIVIIQHGLLNTTTAIVCGVLFGKIEILAVCLTYHSRYDYVIHCIRFFYPTGFSSLVKFI